MGTKRETAEDIFSTIISKTGEENLIIQQDYLLNDKKSFNRIAFNVKGRGCINPGSVLSTPASKHLQNAETLQPC